MLVVDASVAAMWFLPEEGSEQAAQVLQSSDELVAPDLLRLEVGNALLKAVRRRQMTAADAEEALGRLAPPAIRFEVTGPLVTDAQVFALRRGGSIYDATYIVLALELGGRLVTADRAMANVAISAGVEPEVISPP